MTHVTFETGQFDGAAFDGSALLEIAHLDAACFVVAPNGTVSSVSGGLLHMTGLEPEAFLGKTPDRLFPIFKNLSRELWKGAATKRSALLPNVWIRSSNGGYGYFDFHLSRITSPGQPATGQPPQGHFFYATPQIENVQARKDLLQSVYQDALTGLHNRRYFEIAASDYLRLCKEGQSGLGILLVDVDAFKAINDSHGHAMGDKALCHIARAIYDAVPLGEVVARYGGDEFIVLLHNATTEDDLEDAMRDIRREVGRPWYVGNDVVELSVSIGGSLFPDHGSTLEELVEAADVEMYSAKRAPGRTQRRAKQATPAQSWAAAFLQSLHADEVEPFFQPIVDIATGRQTGAEALCRWRQPGGGYLDPQDFVPLAEGNHVIRHLDRYMFRRACALFSADLHNLPPDFRISINASTLSLHAEGFAQDILSYASEFGVPPHKLCLEITESDSWSDGEVGKLNLAALNEAGISIALDDFGTGFSSLSLLQDLPVSRIKIDKSFLKDICRSARKSGIVKSVLVLCESLQAECVAEGIETEEQRALLVQMGCPLGQGYLFGAPQQFEDYQKDLVRNAPIPAQ